MQFENLESFLKQAHIAVMGPVAIILAEDDVELTSTINHHLRLGFLQVIVVGNLPILSLPDALPEAVDLIHHDLSLPDAGVGVVNRLMPVLDGQWVYYGYNAEYLFYPFCESRSVRELLAFNTEEKRDTILTYVVDLYAADLDVHPNGVDHQSAHFDKVGYYGEARANADGVHLAQQMNIHGGLRWRFEEHIPKEKRHIDRVGIFKARRDLVLGADHRFNAEDYNTYACPWHHNITAAICSFRTAKALKYNPGSAFDIPSYHWHYSEPFQWHSGQLLENGMIEAGQWF